MKAYGQLRTKPTMLREMAAMLAVSALLSGHPTTALAQAFYISPTGNDTNPGTRAAPFATLPQAALAMRKSSTKTTCLRAGNYPVSTTLTLTSADDGETWQCDPSDGIDRAILDGGSTAPNTGVDIFTIIGGSHITINGLTIRNHRNWGVGIHGGNTDPRGDFPVTAKTADHDTITNNLIQGGWTTDNSGWSGGGVWAQGQVTNLTIKNNVIQDEYGSGIRIGANGDGASPNDTIAGYDVENNVILNTDINTGDNGAIYTQDQNFASADPPNSRRNIVRNNFIRDYQGRNAIGNVPARDVAIYFDRGSSNADITGNIIASTANAITTPAESTQALFVGGSHRLTISGNIVDLGRTACLMNLAYGYEHPTDPATTGNVIAGNIFIGDWSGSQRSGFFARVNIAYALAEHGEAVLPALTHNVYYNYGSGSLGTNGNVFGDASPIFENPKISAWTYLVAPDSPVFAAPVHFHPIIGGWGPPAYRIPQTGTPPSCPHR